MSAVPRWTIITVIITMLALAGGGPAANAYDLTVVKRAITAHHARWQAGETSLTRLPLKRVLNRLGWIPVGRAEYAGEHRFVAADSPLPASYDWRELGVVSGVRNQGDCGSCWAFATVGALESLQMIEDGDKQVDDSEQFLVSYNFMNHGCRGGVLSFAANFLSNFGTVTETCMPYRADRKLLPPPCQQWPTDRVGIEQWSPVNQDVKSLKAAVYQSPVAAAMYVFQDFLSYTEGVYSHVSGKLLGGHGILIVGWDDAEKCFIVKNSWGEDWGEAGFFKIAYSEVQSAVKFGSEAVLYSGLWHADAP